MSQFSKTLKTELIFAIFLSSTKDLWGRNMNSTGMRRWTASKLFEQQQNTFSGSRTCWADNGKGSDGCRLGCEEICQKDLKRSGETFLLKASKSWRGRGGRCWGCTRASWGWVRGGRQQTLLRLGWRESTLWMRPGRNYLVLKNQ